LLSIELQLPCKPLQFFIQRVLSSVVLFAGAVMAAGPASDKGMGRLKATILVCGIAGKFQPFLLRFVNMACTFFVRGCVWLQVRDNCYTMWSSLQFQKVKKYFLDFLQKVSKSPSGADLCRFSAQRLLNLHFLLPIALLA
jgi:hypothetical protein